MIDLVSAHTLPSAFAVLPPAMESAEARALLLATGLQESRFEHRRQVGGPARGFWQFELSGVRAVLNHHASRPPMLAALAALQYPPDTLSTDPALSYVAIEHNDVLAACFARCLLWTLAGALPGPSDAATAWAQYTAAWRPGKPHSGTWAAYYSIAWGAVLKGRAVPPTLKA